MQYTSKFEGGATSFPRSNLNYTSGSIIRAERRIPIYMQEKYPIFPSNEGQRKFRGISLIGIQKENSLEAL